MANNIELLRQALSASESSIKLAKQLLSEVERGATGQGKEKSKGKSLPGTIGTYDGENMVTESGDKHPVPANYASKSMLVVGDTLKLVEDKGEKRFKQIEHVKRYKTKGVLAKKEGKFHAVAPEGSYKVLPAAVDHFNVAVGDELNIWIPAKDLHAGWAAIESLVGKEKANSRLENKEPVAKPVVEEKKEEVKEKAPQAKEATKKPKEEKPEEKAKSVKLPKKPKEETKEDSAKSAKVQEAPAVSAVKNEEPANKPDEDELA